MIIENGDWPFKFLTWYFDLTFIKDIRYLQLFSIYFLLGYKIGKITLNSYLVSLEEIIENCLDIWSGALLIISGYNFGLHLGKTVFTYLILIETIVKLIYPNIWSLG